MYNRQFTLNSFSHRMHVMCCVQSL